MWTPRRAALIKGRRLSEVIRYLITSKSNEDQTLIQIKRLEKIQHIESVQRCTNLHFVTLTEGPL